MRARRGVTRVPPSRVRMNHGPWPGLRTLVQPSPGGGGRDSTPDTSPGGVHSVDDLLAAHEMDRTPRRTLAGGCRRNGAGHAQADTAFTMDDRPTFERVITLITVAVDRGHPTNAAMTRRIGIPERTMHRKVNRMNEFMVSEVVATMNALGLWRSEELRRVTKELVSGDRHAHAGRRPRGLRRHTCSGPSRSRSRPLRLSMRAARARRRHADGTRRRRRRGGRGGGADGRGRSGSCRDRARDNRHEPAQVLDGRASHPIAGRVRMTLAPPERPASTRMLAASRWSRRLHPGVIDDRYSANPSAHRTLRLVPAAPSPLRRPLLLCELRDRRRLSGRSGASAAGARAFRARMTLPQASRWDCRGSHHTSCGTLRRRSRPAPEPM